MKQSVASDLAARARAVIPGGVNSGQRQVPGLEDLVVVRTHGCTFEDADGREYTDYHAAFGPALLGHNDPDVDRAFAETARAVDLMGVGVTPIEVELAEKLVEIVPSFERVLLTSTGSEATFHALRLARAVTGRRHVVKFQGCYHGWHDSVAMNVISRADRVGHKDPLSMGILPEVIDATLVLPFNDLDGGRAARSTSTRRRRRDHPRADPAQHRRVLPPPGFLEGLRELCTREGIVLVFDEVITGFRHALGGYQSICGVTPDLTHRRQGDGQRLPDRRARRAGRPDGPVQHDARQPRLLRRHVQRAPAVRRRRARDDREARGEPVHEHIFALGERIRGELADALRAPRRAGRGLGLRLGLRPLLPRRPGHRRTTTCSRTTSSCSSATAARCSTRASSSCR